MNEPQPQYFRPDLDEAKGLAGALKRLAPPDRIRWLRLCCLKASQGGMRLDVIAGTLDGEIRELLADFYTIVGMNGLTIEWATGLVEHMARGKRIRDFLDQAGLIRG